MMELYSIASGSSGNCIFVGEEKKGILIDAGISKKRIEEGLAEQDIFLEEISGIFITHEHSDHISGLGPILRKYAIPVYATEKTIDYLLYSGRCGKMDSQLFQCIHRDVPVSVGGMEIMPFSISHDALDPVCYTIKKGEYKAAVATDMGEYDEYTISHLKDCDGVLLEANHDINMLQVGKYPYSLKMRILGKEGHLSNDACGRLLRRLICYQLKYVLLGHLSQENNYPELAYETVKYEMEQGEFSLEAEDVFLGVARRHAPTAPMSVSLK